MNQLQDLSRDFLQVVLPIRTRLRTTNETTSLTHNVEESTQKFLSKLKMHSSIQILPYDARRPLTWRHRTAAVHAPSVSMCAIYVACRRIRSALIHTPHHPRMCLFVTRDNQFTNSSCAVDVTEWSSRLPGVRSWRNSATRAEATPMSVAVHAMD